MATAVTVLSLFVVSCGAESEPTPSPSPVGAITVGVGGDLGLGPTDRIFPALSVGVWRALVDADRVTVSERHLVGDESGAGYRIVLDFAEDLPTIVEAVATKDDASAGTSSEPLGPGTLVLQDASPTGVISGEYTADSGGGFRFWVDTAENTYVKEPRLGDTFELRPGGVADSFSFATQFVEVVEDSRCLPDVQCVWEGRVVVALRYVWEAGSEDFQLEGLLTPGGPVYGDSPTYPDTTNEFSTVELAFVGLEGEVATFEWVSTE